MSRGVQQYTMQCTHLTVSANAAALRAVVNNYNDEHSLHYTQETHDHTQETHAFTLSPIESDLLICLLVLTPLTGKAQLQIHPAVASQHWPVMHHTHNNRG